MAVCGLVFDGYSSSTAEHEVLSPHLSDFSDVMRLQPLINTIEGDFGT